MSLIAWHLHTHACKCASVLNKEICTSSAVHGAKIRFCAFNVNETQCAGWYISFMTKALLQDNNYNVVGDHWSLTLYWQGTSQVMRMVSQNCVPLQLFILMVFGVWPLWRRPFRKSAIINTLVFMYFVCVTLLWAAKEYKQVCFVLESYNERGTKVLMIVRRMGEASVRLSIFHLAIFGHHKLLCCDMFCKQQGSRKCNLSFTLLVLGSLIFLETGMVFSSYSYFMRQINFEIPSNGGTQDIIQAVAAPFQAVIRYILQPTLLPSVLVLSHSFPIHNEFKTLEDTIKANIHSKEVLINPKLLSDVKYKFWEICNVATTMNEVFRFYLITVIPSICFNIFNYTYIWSMKSCNIEGHVYVSLILCALFALVLLCVSGNLITGSVSVCFLFAIKSNERWTNFLSLFGSLEMWAKFWSQIWCFRLKTLVFTLGNWTPDDWTQTPTTRYKLENVWSLSGLCSKIDRQWVQNPGETSLRAVTTRLILSSTGPKVLQSFGQFSALMNHTKHLGIDVQPRVCHCNINNVLGPFRFSSSCRRCFFTFRTTPQNWRWAGSFHWTWEQCSRWVKTLPLLKQIRTRERKMHLTVTLLPSIRARAKWLFFEIRDLLDLKARLDPQWHSSSSFFFAVPGNICSVLRHDSGHGRKRRRVHDLNKHNKCLMFSCWNSQHQ